MHPAEELAQKLHNEDNAKSPHSHVYQVWQDGEITLQKCGPLLWQRNLHLIAPACLHYVTGLKFPGESGPNSYAFVANQEEANQIRALLEVKV
jgi:hypothetical protein